MVKLKEDNGKIYAIPNFGRSGMITLLSDSDGYIVIKSHEEGIYKGEEERFICCNNVFLRENVLWRIICFKKPMLR